MRAKSIWVVAVLCTLGLTGSTTSAQAYRPLVNEEVLKLNPAPTSPSPPPDGQVEGICGLAPVGGTLYVSEYYRQRVDLFSLGTGSYAGQVPAFNPLDGVCGLARSAGSIYANEWHERVLRLLPSVQIFDSGHESTGVGVDSAGNVYADDRSYVAVYEPSGAKVLHEGLPLKIGLGSLEDGYGVAVSGGRVYVADAADHKVKVYEPAGDPFTPVTTIDPGFTSLVDSALAIDPVSGHLVVVDNLQPGYESPKTVIDEFEPNGTFLDRLSRPVVDGGPSGLAFDPSGDLFVSSGNTEGSNVIEFGPYAAAGPSTFAAAASSPQPGAAGTADGDGRERTPSATAKPRGATASEVVQHGRLRVAVQAKLTPKKLPRTGGAPVHFSLSAKIASTDGSIPPQLRRIEVEINRHGHIDPAGLPTCRIEQIQPATTKGALEACRSSLVGAGTFSAKVLLTQQAPFPSAGEVVAFNGRWHGKPAILAHIFGTQPIPTSYTLPFVIARVGKGTYGTALKVSLPRFTSKWGYVTGISLDLGRRTSRGGYLTAGCPAPKGFGGASFPLARASLSFAEGPKAVDQTLTRSCGVR